MKDKIDAMEAAEIKREEDQISKEKKHARKIITEMERLNKLVPKKIQCCLCLESMTASGRTPARLCENGHYICASPCVKDLFDSQVINFEYNVRTNLPQVSMLTESISVKCPQCRALVTLDDVKRMSDPFIYEVLRNADEPCPYTGCSKSYGGRALVRHVLTCSFRSYNCLHCQESIRHDKLDQHIQEECVSLPCRFCKNSPIGHSFKPLRDHMDSLHGRHVDLLESLQYYLNAASDMVSESYAFRQLRTNNVPISYSILQESLHLHEILFQFVSHCDEETYMSTWSSGQEQNAADMLQHVRSNRTFVDDLILFLVFFLQLSVFRSTQ